MKKNFVILFNLVLLMVMVNVKAWDIGIAITDDNFNETQVDDINYSYYNRDADLNYEEFLGNYNISKFGDGGEFTVKDSVDYDYTTDTVVKSKLMQIETSTTTNYLYYPCQPTNYSSDIILTGVITLTLGDFGETFLVGCFDGSNYRYGVIIHVSGTTYNIFYSDNGGAQSNTPITLTLDSQIYFHLALYKNGSYYYYVEDLETSNAADRTGTMGIAMPSVSYYYKLLYATYGNYGVYNVYALDSNTILSYYDPFYSYLYGLKLVDDGFTVDRVLDFYCVSNVAYNSLCYNYDGIAFSNNINDSYTVEELNCTTASNVTSSTKFRYQRCVGYNISYNLNNEIVFENLTIVDNSDFYFSIVVENLTDNYFFEIDFTNVKLWVEYGITNITVGSYSGGGYHYSTLVGLEDDFIDYNDIIVHFCRDGSDGKMYYYVQQNNRKLISIYWTELEIPYESDNWDYEFIGMSLRNYNTYGQANGNIILKGVNYYDNFTYYNDIGKLYMNDITIILSVYSYSDIVYLETPELPPGYNVTHALLEHTNITIQIDGANEYETVEVCFDFGENGNIIKDSNEEFNITRTGYIDAFQEGRFSFMLNRTYNRFAVNSSIIELNIDFDSLWYAVFEIETPSLVDILVGVIPSLLILIVFPVLLYGYLGVLGGVFGFVIAIIVLWFTGMLEWYQSLILMIGIMGMLVHTYKKRKRKGFGV